MSYCGIDFGTSNSSVGVIRQQQAVLIEFADRNTTTPSAVFYSGDSADTFFGQLALTQYTSGFDGRLLRALKSVLGSSLLEEKTIVRNQQRAFKDIIQDYVAYLKDTLDQYTADSVQSVVLGRPVQFVDGDEKRDRAAQATLYEIATALGFKHVEFQFEPIAAALSYESQVSQEELALIVDIGGGTADFSIIRISPKAAESDQRKNDILATMGIHIGGTDIDRALSLSSAMPLLGYRSLTKQTHRELPSSIYFDLATWHKIPTLYKNDVLQQITQIQLDAQQPDKVQMLHDIVRLRLGHALASEVEATKIRLTNQEQTFLALSMLQAQTHFQNNEVLNASAQVSRVEMENSIEGLMQQLIDCVSEGLKTAQLAAQDITTVFFTGGSSSIPRIRQCIQQTFPSATVVQGDEFGSVGLGLALDARKKFD